jgi:hypothetical protein
VPGDPEVDVLDVLVMPGTPDVARDLRGRRVLYGATSLVLAVIVLLAVLDGVGVTEAYGVATDHVRDEGGGCALDVRYSTVSRPALATPFEIEVRRPGGFDGPVSVAVSHEYLRIWDENGLYPTPSSETTMGGWLVWEFAPPLGDTLRLTYDGRIEPGAQRGQSGAVAVLEDDVPVLDVEFRTRLRP